jgi:hypothetical protein
MRSAISALFPSADPGLTVTRFVNGPMSMM